MDPFNGIDSNYFSGGPYKEDDSANVCEVIGCSYPIISEPRTFLVEKDGKKTAQRATAGLCGHHLRPEIAIQYSKYPLKDGRVINLHTDTITLVPSPDQQ